MCKRPIFSKLDGLINIETTHAYTVIEDINHKSQYLIDDKIQKRSVEDDKELLEETETSYLFNLKAYGHISRQ